MTPGDSQKPPGDDRKASGNDQKPDDQKVPGNNDNPPTLSEKAINQVVDGLQSAPSVQATTGVASAVRGLGSVLTPSESLSTDPFSEIWRALEDMRIPPQHAQRLQPLFSEIGLDLKDDAVPDPDNASISRRFTTVCGEGTKIAVRICPKISYAS